MARRDEIMGGIDEILGDENFDETVGLLPPPPGSRRVGAVPYNRVQYSQGRMLAVGLSSTGTIAAAAQATLTVQPQTLFRPERWVISDPTNAFTIQDLRIGKNSQFVAAGSQPSATFGPNSFGVRLKMDTCQVSMIIAAVVTNVSAGAVAFVSSLIGSSIL